jgi:transcriptional regulator with XRE-family HTH domain
MLHSGAIQRLSGVYYIHIGVLVNPYGVNCRRDLPPLWRRWYTAPMTLGRRILIARLEAGYKRQEDFAVAVGAKLGTVRHWEADERVPRDAAKQRIVAVTGKPLSWFYGEQSQGSGQAQVAPAQRDPSLLRNRLGFQALLADPQARERAGLTDRDLQMFGNWSIPEEDLPLGTLEEVVIFLRTAQTVYLIKR